MKQPSIQLKLGDLRFYYKDGALRYLKWGNTEIVRMVYSAIRDRNWNTIAGEIRLEEVRRSEGAFSVRLSVEYDQGEIRFREFITIEGEKAHISFTTEGEALSTFKKNRIGLCILHPVKECAGKTCKITHTEGLVKDYWFPDYVAPRQPMTDIMSMEWDPAAGLTAKVDFEGEVFEMEDQRNWTDASFKTYGTPLGLPFPAEIKAGEKIRQTIDISVTVKEGYIQPPENRDDLFTFRVDRSACFPLPELGTCKFSDGRRLTENEIKLLRGLPFSHYRVEIKLYEQNWAKILEEAAAESVNLGWPLFIVAYFSSDSGNEAESFVKALKTCCTRVKYCLPVRQDHLSDNELAKILHERLNPVFPGLETGIGVNAYFAELNRARPESQPAPFVNFTISPQVHAFDDETLVENIQCQGEVVRSAKKLFPNKKIFISPVTLKQRFNVVATADEKELPASVSPLPVDVRQQTGLGAGWLLGSIKYLAENRADLVSYFEAIGRRGFIQADSPPGLTDTFPSQEGEIFPVYKVLKELATFNETVKSYSSAPLILDGIVVKNGSRLKLMLANFSQKAIHVKIEGFGKLKSLRSLYGETEPGLVKDTLTINEQETVVIVANS